MPDTEIPPIAQAAPAYSTANQSQALSAKNLAAPVANQQRIQKVARQFEAMFMTEMLHQAHEKSHAVGVFRTGQGESAMQPFMDQALGDAVAARGGTGIAKSIERLLSGPSSAKSSR